MRLLPSLVLLAVALAGCSKSPEGLYAHEHGGARIYREGDGLFIELVSFPAPRSSTPVVAKLERKGDSLTIVGPMAAVAITLTDSGLLLTAGGRNETFTRLPASSTPKPLTEARAVELIRAQLASELEHARAAKGCRGVMGVGTDRSLTELAALQSLLDKASVTVATVQPSAATDSRWADEYDVTGALTTPALSERVEHGSVCTATDIFGSCTRHKDVPVDISTSALELPFRARVVVSRCQPPIADYVELERLTKGAPDGHFEYCYLLATRALAYREVPAR